MRVSSVARRRALALIAWTALSVSGCASDGSPAPVEADEVGMDRIARSYVELVLAVGLHDDDYVDAYYGPSAWRDAVDERASDLGTIAAEAAEQLESLAALDPPSGELDRLRHRYLTTQLGALSARVEILRGARMSFDEESRALYDAVSPRRDEGEFEAVLAELAELLPGEGELIERYERFREAFVIPTDRVDRVFRAAIDACRERTARYLDLPVGERFDVEYVTDKPWSGYNWYQGSYVSLIQVNTDLPIAIDRAVDLACHEGYPGHHLYNALLERELVRGRGWVELSVYPLFSPQSLIAEGTANYGIELAFPGEERVEFERTTLFPLAGLDPAAAGTYYRVEALVAKLSYAGNEAARRYLDGEIDAAAAADALVRFAMMPRPRAEQRVRFIERYRSYVINYNLGLDLVRDWVERQCAQIDDAGCRWHAFGSLISSPRLPSALQ